MKRIVIFLSFLLAALVLIASCGMANRSTREFESLQRDYLMRLRWQDYASAASYMIPENSADFLDRFRDWNDLHITNVQVEKIEYLEEENLVRTVSLVEYYLLPSATIKTFRLKEEWEWQEGERTSLGDWVLISPFPDFP